SKKLKGQDKLVLNNVSFDIKAGEIVCLAGIDGNGQSELVNVITGLDSDFTGNILFNGEDISKATIRERIDEGMSHIPEDRQKFGLILNYTLAENMITNQYYKPRFSKRGILKNQEILDYTNNLIEEYDIRSGEGAKTFARSLSGGNQQKAIFARETSKPHNLLIASQPTRGLDVGAIEFVHKTIVTERDKGNAIFVVSFELDEVTDLADRILVIYEGAIVGELDPKKTNHAELGLYMLGTKQNVQKVEAGDHYE
ncbi:MAG TPA: ATP-binding cassette domain-containing protein, partial [Bacilli bacterium]|nr:ATP-binding cassette domain-containing protein [Bacilli bacterium]